MSDFFSSIPDSPTAQREAMIVGALKEGRYERIEWCPIRILVGDLEAVFHVGRDALKIEGVRVNLTHAGAQKVADLLGVALPTTRLSDLAHAQAGMRLSPCTFPPDAYMGHTGRMLAHSKAVDERVKAAAGCGLVSTVGKDWVLTNLLEGKPDKAANYGWHSVQGRFMGPSGLAVLQPLGLAHNKYHVDYSQVFRPVNRWVRVNGDAMMLESLLTDPTLAPLASDEGVLRITRHPGVPLEVEVEPMEV